MGEYDLGDKRVLSIMYEGAFYPIGYMTSNAITESSEMLDVTAREDGGWSTAIPTRQSASISLHYTSVRTHTNQSLSSLRPSIGKKIPETFVMV